MSKPDESGTAFPETRPGGYGTTAILDMAGDYAAAKQTKHFIVMLRKVAADLEGATP